VIVLATATRTAFKVEHMVIKSLYGLTPPSPKEVADRDAKVAQAIKEMGHKYLLSKPIPRIR
jgi:hypothetical protein